MSDNNGWRPIETAPKDGRLLLMCRESGFCAFIGHFEYGAWMEGETGILRDPTHWMPLPEPPK